MTSNQHGPYVRGYTRVTMAGTERWCSAKRVKSLNSSKRSEGFSKSSLIETAKNVAMTYGPAYVAYFKSANVLDIQVFQKEDYGDSFPEIKNR